MTVNRMPVEISDYGIGTVATVGAYLWRLLEHAETVKPSRALEPALTKGDFDDIHGHMARLFAGIEETGTRKLRQFAIVETAARGIFGQLVATTAVDAPDFVRVWNLLDVLAVLADGGDCDSPLNFWLVEELLDSQTVADCRRVFDYLESRREAMTARHFDQTRLIILRSCNNLLKRLSRADDTPFCGRVFIFLFQAFPLGDKSSVNLRGEYHVENVTTYEAETEPTETEPMEVDGAVDYTALYPVFWSLQEYFSQPRVLFEPDRFSAFKAGMEASLGALRKITSRDDARKNKLLDAARRGTKRAGVEGESGDGDSYNPKYLTSRDLFELETGDLTFRRHFLLQALIVMEFLLSLSAAAKARQPPTSTSNKSVTYAATLDDDDAAWAARMKSDITEHIKVSNADGPYFLRMVDTILARDKNWVRWKMESCPPIERPAVTPAEYAAAADGAARAFGVPTSRKTAPAFALDFLDDEDPVAALDELRTPARTRGGDLGALEGDIRDEAFDLEAAERSGSAAERTLAAERKASKTWRALRIVRQTRLAALDKVDSDGAIDAVFADDAPTEAVADAAEAGADAVPVVLSAPTVDIAAAVAALLDAQHPGVFGIVAQQTTRPASQHLEHVDAHEFDKTVDNDGFVGFGETGGFMYGTRRRAMEDVAAAGRVPVAVMSAASAVAAHENAYAARFVFVQPADEVLDEIVRAADAKADDAAVAAAKSATPTDVFARVGVESTDLAVAASAVWGVLQEAEPKEPAEPNAKPDTEMADGPE